MDLRSEEVEQQRDQKSPRQDSPREVQRRQNRADDVADPDVGRADGGSGEKGDAAGRQGVLGAQRAETQRARSQLPNLDEDLLRLSEQADGADERPEAHVVEQILGRLSTALAGLVDLARGDRLRERQVRILHHDPPDQRHEEHAEEPPDQHERGRFPVGVPHPERGPGAGEHERRQCKDGSRRNRLADRSGRTSDVLLQNRPAAQPPEDRHADHRRGVGRSNGDAGSEAQVGVGGSQDKRHRDPEDHRARRELSHGHRFGYERLVPPAGRGLRTLWLCHGVASLPVSLVRHRAVRATLPQGLADCQRRAARGLPSLILAAEEALGDRCDDELRLRIDA